MTSKHPLLPGAIRSLIKVLPGASPAVLEATDVDVPPRGPESSHARPQPTPLPPKPANTRYYSLDVWRGAACVMLVFYHATFYGDYHFRIGQVSTWSWAGLPLYAIRHFWFGVPIFFVISGYCIAASADSLRRRPHSLRDYFIRRFRRIYPPLWIMCGVAVLFIAGMNQVGVVRASCQQLFDLSTMTAGQWLGNFAAAESWRHHLGGGEPGFLMANTWTLCYEEQFYVVTGFLLALAARRFFQAAAVVTAAVFVAWCASQGLNLHQHGFFWDGHWLMFAAGILVYRALAYNQPRGRSKAIGVFLLAMIVGASQKVLAREHFDRHMGEYLFVAGGFAIALLFLRRWDRQIAELSVFKPLLWVGQRSYSIYLTHYLVVVVVSSCLAYGGLQSEWQVAAIVVPVCLLLSLPIAMLFYELVERRFLNKPV